MESEYKSKHMLFFRPDTRQLTAVMSKRISGIGDLVETLRANKRVPHLVLLSVAAVTGLLVMLWQVGLIGNEVIEYIETHGWTRAMERFDQVTAPLWKGNDT